MVSKFSEGCAALAWGCPWHVWKGRAYPTDEDKAFMIAIYEARAEMDNWERFVTRPKDS